MNKRMITILLSAFVIASGASYVVYRLVGRQINSSGTHAVATVVIADRDLEMGTVIRASDLKTGKIIGQAPKDAVLKMEAAVGRGVITPIYAGEAVVEKRLAPTGSGGGLAVTIPSGMRACAVKVNDVVGLAGFVLPGMRVDVLIAANTRGYMGGAGTKVKTLLQDIQVLSAGKNFQHDNDGKPMEVQVVNLLVTPDQAEILSLVSNETRIQLALRNPLDHQVATPPGTELSHLFGTPEEPAPLARPAVKRAPVPVVAAKIEPPAPPQVVVKVTNGGKLTESKFVLEGETW